MVGEAGLEPATSRTPFPHCGVQLRQLALVGVARLERAASPAKGGQAHFWSGRRDSNPRPHAPHACALPTALLPEHLYPPEADHARVLPTELYPDCF